MSDAEYGEYIGKCNMLKGEIDAVKARIQRGEYKPKKKEINLWAILMGLAILAVIAITLMGCEPAYAWTDEELVNAIYKAEGGAKARYAYGIRSVSYNSIEEARRICLNTVRNNKKRFAKQTKYKDYLSFLASRYCPIGCDNDNGTNRFWIANVKYFLGR